MEQGKHRILTTAAAVVMMVAVAWLLLHNLGKKPLRIWDESRVAANSIEMCRDGYSLVTTYNGEPDMWNTKPPLLVWLQATSLHLFGISEWSVRFPSALAGLGIAMLLFLFLRHEGIHPITAAVTAMIPFTTVGALEWHAFRSADYDALLTLFTTASGLALFRYASDRKGHWIYLAAVFVALSVLTKSVGGLLFLPAMGLWLLITPGGPGLLRKGQLWAAVLVAVALVAGYYLGREAVNPGYLKQVDLNEISGRYFDVNEGNTGDYGYYLRLLGQERFGYWIWVLAPAIPLSLINRDRRMRQLAAFSALMWFSYLVFISVSQTKLRWYDIPAYPFMAITIGTGLHSVTAHLRHMAGSRIRPALLNAGRILVPLFLLIKPLSASVHLVTHLPEPPWDEVLYHTQYVIKDAISGEKGTGPYRILTGDLNQRLTFYLIHAEMRGVKVRTAVYEELAPGDSVIVDNEAAYERLSREYAIFTAGESPWPTIRMVRLEAPQTSPQ